MIEAPTSRPCTPVVILPVGISAKDPASRHALYPSVSVTSESATTSSHVPSQD